MKTYKVENAKDIEGACVSEFGNIRTHVFNRMKNHIIKKLNDKTDGKINIDNEALSIAEDETGFVIKYFGDQNDLIADGVNVMEEIGKEMIKFGVK